MSSGIDNGLCFIYFLSAGQNLNPRKGSIGKSSLWHREDRAHEVVSHCYLMALFALFFFLKAQFLDSLLLILLNNSSSLSTFGCFFL